MNVARRSMLAPPGAASRQTLAHAMRMQPDPRRPRPSAPWPGFRPLIALAATLVGVGLPALVPARNAPRLAALTADDLVRMERLSEVAAAPDGRRVAFTRRTVDFDLGAAHTAVWVVDAARHGAPAARVSEAGFDAKSAEWSADGKALYFLSKRSGSYQVWRVSWPSGGSAMHDAAPVPAPEQVTFLPLDVDSFHLAPRGNHLVVSLAVFPDCADLACTKQRLDDAARAKAKGRLYKRLFVRHWDEWSDGRISGLFSLPLGAWQPGAAQAAPVKLSADIGDVPGKPFGGREDYAISPDGTRVAFSVKALAEEAWSTNFDLYEVPIEGGSPRNLTADNPASDARPRYSPDGGELAYLAMDRAGDEADRFHLALIDVKTGLKHALTPDWDRSIVSFAWASDGKSLFATTDHLGQRPLWAIDAKTGRASAITGSGEVEDFDVGAGRIFYAASTLGAPADLFEVGYGGGGAKPLTHLNQATLSQRKLGEYDQFTFPGAGGDNVFGYVVKPPYLDRNKRYPMAFVVHGGPESSFANSWSWRWNAQVLAGAGYGVVMIDFHGSTGYGQAFTDAIVGDWGGKPLEDLKSGLAAALKQYPWLDGSRACALGASYGGYMMNWIAGQWPDRFKCIVTHDGIFDTRDMYYSSEELWFTEWENGGPEFKNPGGYTKHNPADFVANWKTPTLVVHGQLDYRVPDAQGLSVFTALQRRGIPSELLYFPNENHWVLKPADSLQWYGTVLEWLDRWTRP